MIRIPPLLLAAFLCAALVPAVSAKPTAIDPATVAVLYNSSDPASGEIARAYLAARDIPEANLVGLPMPTKSEISRDEFVESVRQPLAQVFDERGWWKRAHDPEGRLMAVANRIRVLVTIRGVPLKIAREPAPEPAEGAEKPKGPQLHLIDEAAVDSELAMLGVEGLPLGGPLENKYFESDTPIADERKLPFMMLVGRIDAHKPEVCLRMIKDAVAAEKTGLWGLAYVDVAKKIPQGDEWLEDIAKANVEAGIPTVVDRHKDTLPSHYPATSAALYYGWYAHHRNGFLLDPSFAFKRGAVAVHLHSFSALQLRNPSKNWSAALLAAGAAATLGNVYEPFLAPTHHLNLFHRRLLDGFSLVEAAYMSVPVVSWQSVVLGDPLYRPFLHLGGNEGEIAETDREFRALHIATLRWKNEPAVLVERLETAAEKGNSGTLYEALGLISLNRGREGDAMTFFERARDRYDSPADRLRQELHLVDIDRGAGRKNAAVSRLRAISTDFGPFSGNPAVTALLTILDPPPPPPADPTVPSR